MTTDHEAKARDIMDEAVLPKWYYDNGVYSACVSAIASALREEREACAKIMDEHERASRENGFSDAADIAKMHAAAIRSRNA